MITGKEEFSALVVQDEVVVGVAGRVDDARLEIPESELIIGMEGDHTFGDADAEVGGGRGWPRRPFVHTVAHEEPHELVDVPRRVPHVAGVLDLPGEHEDGRPRALLQPAGEAYVIRMEVGNDDAGDAVLEIEANLRRSGLPRLAGGRVVEAGVYYGPAFVSVHDVGGDEPQREWDGQLELVDALHDA